MENGHDVPGNRDETPVHAQPDFQCVSASAIIPMIVDLQMDSEYRISSSDSGKKKNQKAYIWIAHRVTRRLNTVPYEEVSEQDACPHACDVHQAKVTGNGIDPRYSRLSPVVTPHQTQLSLVPQLLVNWMMRCTQVCVQQCHIVHVLVQNSIICSCGTSIHRCC